MGLVNLCDLQDESKSIEMPEKPQRPNRKLINEFWNF